MVAAVNYDDVGVGTELPARVFPVRRADLVCYAGASGDFNPIHWNERVATAVGLPNVIAHGMFTLAQAARLVTDWAGDPAALVEYGARFTKPVVVPDDEQGTPLEVAGTVTERLPDRRVKIALTATVRYADASPTSVLGLATAVVQLS